MDDNRPTLHVPQPLLHLVRPPTCHSGTLRIVRCVANGAGPSECTAGVTPAPSENLGQTTEARTGPGPLYPRNGKRPPTIQRTCDDTATWPPRRPADGQQRAALRERVTGHQEGSRGLINPSRRMFSTAPVRGVSSWCLRVSPKSTSAQQCPACACGQKTILRAPRWRSSRGTAQKKKSRPAAQRLAATEEWRATPVQRAEWMTVSRYGPPPVCTGRGRRLCTHGVGTAYTPCSPVALHAPLLGASSMASFLSSDAQNASAGSMQCRTSRCVLCCCKRESPIQKFVRVAE